MMLYATAAGTAPRGGQRIAEDSSTIAENASASLRTYRPTRPSRLPDEGVAYGRADSASAPEALSTSVSFAWRRA